MMHQEVPGVGHDGWCRWCRCRVVVRLIVGNFSNEFFGGGWGWVDEKGWDGWMIWGDF